LAIDKRVISTAGRGIAVARGPFSKIGQYLREVWSELRKVIWPTRQEVVKFTIVVLTAMIGVAVFIYVVDKICAAGAAQIFPALKTPQ